MADKYPLQVFGRLLRCTKCNADVDLIELPTPWIDPRHYQCGTCLVPVASPYESTTAHISAAEIKQQVAA